MLFRKMLDLDSGLFVPKEERQPASPTDTISSYMTKLFAVQDSIIKIAVENSLPVDSQHMTSKTSDPFVFEIGSLVLVHYNDRTPPTRLHTVWKGPMRVQNVQDATYVTHKDLVTHKEHRFHSSKMKPFLFDPLVVNSYDVARHDYLEFFVGKILEHRGDLRIRCTISFHIKWLGYNHDHNTWESYANLRDIKQLHKYLAAHKMQSLIPPKVR